MANTLNLGTDGNWAIKEGALLGYNSENSNFKPLPFDFTRASTATYVAEDGLIKTAASGVPRIDFLDSTEGSLKLEPQRTNTVTDSEDYSAWSAGGVTLTTGQLAPDGTYNATKVSGTIGSSSIYKTGKSSTTASRSVYARTVSGTGTARLCSYFGNTNNLFTLTEQWQRFELTDSVSTGGTNFYLADFRGSQTLSEFIVWGAQSEEASYPTSYIKTEGVTATRVADTCSNGGNDQVINSTEGVLYAEIKSFINLDTVDANRYITLTNGTSDERVALLLGGNTSQLRAIIFSSTQSINLSFTTNLTEVKQFNKLAVKYKSGDYSFFLNGIKIGGSTETSIFSANTLNDLSFDVGGGTQQFRGIAKDVRVYNTALTDTELATLTTI